MGSGVHIWDTVMPDNPPIDLVPEETSTSCTFSPDGTRLAMDTVNRDISVWNLPELRRERTALGLGLDWE